MRLHCALFEPYTKLVMYEARQTASLLLFLINTDVVALIISFLHSLKASGLKKICLLYGSMPCLFMIYRKKLEKKNHWLFAVIHHQIIGDGQSKTMKGLHFGLHSPAIWKACKKTFEMRMQRGIYVEKSCKKAGIP